MRKEVTIWRVMSKKLLIAGGGIGGMAAALAAARAGWQVQVLERASAFSEVGAGVQIGPNVTRVLHAWGLQEALRAVAAFPDALLVRDAASGAELGYMQLGERAQRLYGAPYATIHRADLHQALAAAAQAESQVQVHAGQALAHINRRIRVGVRAGGVVERHHFVVGERDIAHGHAQIRPRALDVALARGGKRLAREGEQLLEFVGGIHRRVSCERWRKLRRPSGAPDG